MRRAIERKLVRGLLLPLVLLGAQTAPATAQTRAGLQAVVDSVIATPPLNRAHWGVQLVDAGSGRVLAAHDAERSFYPASSMKLPLAAFALAELGPHYRFETPVYVVGAARGGAERIVVVGRGDPSMSFRYGGGEYAALERMADSIAALGVRRADELVIDASWFADAAVHPAWLAGDVPWGFAAPVEAFGVGEGSFRVVLAPGASAGAPAVLTLIGAHAALPVRNAAVTGRSGSGLSVDVARSAGGDSVVVSGSIALGAAPDTTPVAAPSPAAFAGDVLRDALARRGVNVAAVRVVYDPAAAAALRAPAAPSFTWRSPPLHEILAGFLPPSRNWHAEMILKTIAARQSGRGSWAAGRSAERRFLIDAVGLDSTSFVVSDASGLSQANLMTPASLVKLLDYARRQPWAPYFRAALAAPGQPGTLSDRLLPLRGRVAAKTGTFTGAVSLAGYLDAGDGRDVIFAVVANQTGVPSSRVRAGIDRIVSAAARH